VEIERRRADVEDAEWELEWLLDSQEDSSCWGSTEASEARLRQDALADAEIRRKLDAMDFSKHAHARLDYLLTVAFSCIGVFNRRRALSLNEEIQRAEADPGPVN
jgi:hypothetical protein